VIEVIDNFLDTICSDFCGEAAILSLFLGITDALMFLKKLRLTKLLESMIMHLLMLKLSSIGGKA
jgi:hypothetical protein